MKNCITHTEETRKESLDLLSCNTIEDLFKQIPIKFKEFNM